MPRAPHVAALVVIVSLVACDAWGQAWMTPLDCDVAVNGLQGARVVGLVVDDLEEVAGTRAGLTRERLRTTLAAALLRSGTVEVAAPETLMPIVLYLNVHLSSTADNRIIFSVSLDLAAPAVVYPAGPDQRGLYVLARLWHKGIMHGAGPDNMIADGVKDAIADLVDDFTVDWHEANPRQQEQ